MLCSQESSATCQRLQAENTDLEQKMCQQNDILLQLQSQVANSQQLIENLQTQHEELQNEHHISVKKSSKDTELLQETVREADDRIQELESCLSSVERELGEVKLNRDQLKSEFNKSEATLLQSQDGHNRINETITRMEEERDALNAKIIHYEGNIDNLKHVLVDYETKMLDSKVTTQQIIALQATMKRTQDAKLELENLNNSQSHEINNLEFKITNLLIEIENLKNNVAEINENHAKQISDIESENTIKLQSCVNEHEEKIKEIEQLHEIDVKGYMEQSEEERKILEHKHRSQLDEVEADRLQSIAQSQQDKEYWMNKEKDASRGLGWLCLHLLYIIVQYYRLYLYATVLILDVLQKENDKLCVELVELHEKRKDFEK